MDIIVLSMNLLIASDDNIQTICSKINAVYKYLCYNFNMQNLFIIKYAEIDDNTDLVQKISGLYIHNTVVLEDILMIDIPHLPEEINFNSLINTFNDFVKILICSRYNLVNDN